MAPDPGSEDDLLRLDPELEAVLRDLARQHQDSRLFRVPRPSVHTGLFETEAAVRSGTTGLLSAECKLLESYREEVAALLRRISFERLMRLEPARRITSLQIEGGAEIRLTGEHVLLERLRGEAADLRRSVLDSLVVDEVESACRTAERASATPGQLAAASMRFEPHPHARLYMGQEQLVFDSPTSALRTFRAVRSSTWNARDQARSSSWVAASLCRLRRFSEAVVEYEAAANNEFSALGDLLSLFSVSIQAGDLPASLATCQQVDGLGPEHAIAVRSWFATTLVRRRMGDWEPTAASSGLLRSLEPTLGPISRQVLHVFA